MKKATELVTNASLQSDEMQNVLYTHLYQLNEMIMTSTYHHPTQHKNTHLKELAAQLKGEYQYLFARKTL